MEEFQMRRAAQSPSRSPSRAEAAVRRLKHATPTCCGHILQKTVSRCHLSVNGYAPYATCSLLAGKGSHFRTILDATSQRNRIYRCYFIFANQYDDFTIYLRTKEFQPHRNLLAGKRALFHAILAVTSHGSINSQLYFIK